MARYLQEPGKNGAGPTTGDALNVDSFGAAFPALWEFMCLDRWENGKSRVAGSLTLFVEAGMVKCCVNDKDRRMMSFVGASGLVAVLEEVELQLEESRLSWRPAKDRSGR